MKKIMKIQDFFKNQEELMLNKKQSMLVVGGRAEDTNDYCHSYIDTCVDNCSDIHVTRERDGNIYADYIDQTNMSDCTP